ncbi:MAG: ATP-binding protein [Candidatus Omnitrophica bacterium]|nr:ATP-binding protein [Candidatus Omnitrophota bacterium]
MTITVASGKGGTGKTLVATSLALSLRKDVQFLDCDVEEPNGYIFLKPDIKKSETVYLPKPKVDISKCTFCGLCSKLCRYNAISVIKPKNKVLFFYELCHSCGTCSFVCPENAIYEEQIEKGVIEEGAVKGMFHFIQGKLKPSEANPVPLIKAVKKKIKKGKINIVDASPGTSCPVVQAVNNSDFCILVTEPTPFGLNDLTLAVEMTKKMNVPAGVIINRANIGNSKVKEYCIKEKIPILLTIPFRKEIAVAYSKGIPLVEIYPEYVQIFRDTYSGIKDMIK